MKRLPRICWAIPSLRAGGTERQLLYLMQGLASEFELTVICTRTGGAFIGDARRAGVYVRILEDASGWDPRQYWQFRHLFQTHTPHIVHTFLFGFDYFANRAARRSGVPVIISSRRELATWQKRRHLAMQRRANTFVDCVVANSQAVARYAGEREGLAAERIKTIYNGVDAKYFQAAAASQTMRARYRLPEAARLVGIVANFSPVKDHALFIDMACALLARRGDLHFVMAGAGENVGPTMQEIARRGHSARFTCISGSSDLPELYGVFDVCVLTSKSEGFPNVLLEAQAAGRPVVAPAVGGVPELVEDGRTGLLVRTRDPKDFADAVERLLDNPQEATAMGAAGAALVCEEFSVPRMVAAYKHLYIELLQQKLHADA